MFIQKEGSYKGKKFNDICTFLVTKLEVLYHPNLIATMPIAFIFMVTYWITYPFPFNRYFLSNQKAIIMIM